MSTVCPICGSVRTIEESESGQEVTCPGCKAIFAARPLAAKPPRRKRRSRQSIGPLAIGLILFGVFGSLAVIGASIPFFLKLLQVGGRSDARPSRGGDVPVMRGPMPAMGGGNVVVEPEDNKDAQARKNPSPTLILGQAPPALVMPAGADRAVDLAWHPGVGEYELRVQAWFEAKETSVDGTVDEIKCRTLADATEIFQAVDAQARASIHLSWMSRPERDRGVAGDSSRNGGPQVEFPSAQARTELPLAGLYVLADGSGKPPGHRLDLARVAAPCRTELQKVLDSERLLYEFFMLPLPDQAGARPGHSWQFQRTVPYPCTVEYPTCTVKGTLTLQGVHKDRDTDFAVVHINGKIEASGAHDAGPAEELKGWAIIDSTSGLVVQAQIAIPFDLSSTTDRRLRHSSGMLHLTFSRGAPHS
jgi:transcription initiation factor TFIIIB Brf1 subunit/transcription initiation factor TFIIB